VFIHHLSIHPSIYPSIHPSSIHPFIRPSIHPSIIHPPIHPHTHPPIHPHTHPSVHPSIHPSIHPSTHPSSIHPPIRSSTHPSVCSPRELATPFESREGGCHTRDQSLPAVEAPVVSPAPHLLLNIVFYLLIGHSSPSLSPSEFWATVSSGPGVGYRLERRGFDLDAHGAR